METLSGIAKRAIFEGVRGLKWGFGEKIDRLLGVLTLLFLFAPIWLTASSSGPNADVMQLLDHLELRERMLALCSWEYDWPAGHGDKGGNGRIDINPDLVVLEQFNAPTTKRIDWLTPSEAWSMRFITEDGNLVPSIVARMSLAKRRSLIIDTRHFQAVRFFRDDISLAHTLRKFAASGKRREDNSIAFEFKWSSKSGIEHDVKYTFVHSENFRLKEIEAKWGDSWSHERIESWTEAVGAWWASRATIAVNQTVGGTPVKIRDVKFKDFSLQPKARSVEEAVKASKDRKISFQDDIGGKSRMSERDVARMEDRTNKAAAIAAKAFNDSLQSNAPEVDARPRATWMSYRVGLVSGLFMAISVVAFALRWKWSG